MFSRIWPNWADFVFLAKLDGFHVFGRFHKVAKVRGRSVQIEAFAVFFVGPSGWIIDRLGSWQRALNDLLRSRVQVIRHRCPPRPPASRVSQIPDSRSLSFRLVTNSSHWNFITSIPLDL